jgi:hypothetical protein
MIWYGPPFRCLQDGSVLRSTVLIDKFGRILKVLIV